MNVLDVICQYQKVYVGLVSSLLLDWHAVVNGSCILCGHLKCFVILLQSQVLVHTKDKVHVDNYINFTLDSIALTRDEIDR